MKQQTNLPKQPTAVTSINKNKKGNIVSAAQWDYQGNMIHAYNWPGVKDFGQLMDRKSLLSTKKNERLHIENKNISANEYFRKAYEQGIMLYGTKSYEDALDMFNNNRFVVSQKTSHTNLPGLFLSGIGVTEDLWIAKSFATEKGYIVGIYVKKLWPFFNKEYDFLKFDDFVNWINSGKTYNSYLTDVLNKRLLFVSPGKTVILAPPSYGGQYVKIEGVNVLYIWDYNLNLIHKKTITAKDKSLFKRKENDVLNKSKDFLTKKRGLFKQRYVSYHYKRFEPIYKAWDIYGIPEKVVKTKNFGFIGDGLCPACLELREPGAWRYALLKEKPLCVFCYDKYFADNLSDVCVVCGSYVSDEKVNLIKLNPRIIENHLCDFECHAYLIYAFNHALTGKLLNCRPKRN